MYLSLRDRPGPRSRSVPTATRRVAGIVVLLGVVSMLTDISSEMVNAVLPLYLTTQLGLGLLAYGFVDGIYQGVSASVRILGGGISDRTDRPKWIAAIGYGVSALSRIALVPVHGFAAITTVITADRLGKGLRTAPRDALIASSAQPENLGRSFGVHRALDTLGAAIGPLVAFAILAAVPNDYTSVFVVSFAFAMVGVAVLVLLVPNRRTSSAGAPAPGVRTLLATLTAPRLRRPLAAAGLLGLLTVGDGFLYLSLQQRDDFAALWFPLLYVGTNLAYLILAVPFGRLADRIGRSKVFIGGHVALVCVYGVAGGPITGVTSTVLTLALLGTFYAATDGVLPALISHNASAQSRGTEIAAAQTVVAVARFASSVAFGAIWAVVGRGEALVVIGIALACALPLAAVLLRRGGRPATPSSVGGV